MARNITSIIELLASQEQGLTPAAGLETYISCL